MNVKQGDLAIQIFSVAGNEGRIVEILSFLGEKPFYQGSYWAGGQGPTWLVRYMNPILTNHGDLLTECPCADAWLRPVSGLPVNDEVTDDIKEPA